jgi:hypothetical protein
MGLLTNIFVAPTDEPPDPSEDPESKPGEGIQLKSITSMNLSTLWAIIEAVPWTPDFMDGFESLSPEPDGPWLERCPKGLVETLRTVDEEELDRIGREWSATDEMEGWDPADARALVEELIHLAWAADRLGRSMYIWTCL